MSRRLWKAAELLASEGSASEEERQIDGEKIVRSLASDKEITREVLGKAWELVAGVKAASTSTSSAPNSGLSPEKAVGVVQIAVGLILKRIALSRNEARTKKLQLKCKQALEDRLKMLSGLPGGQKVNNNSTTCICPMH